MSKLSRRGFNRMAMATAAAGLVESAAAARAAALAEEQGRAGSLTDVPGIKLGHFTDSRRPTGCTAILFDTEATAGVDYDGSAPGSYLGMALQPVSPVQTIHALFLTGGGLMGLPAMAGVVRYMEERKIGFNWGTPEVLIPLTVGGVIADLEIGDPHIRPDAEAAYKACVAASTAPVAEGNVGVGAGGTVGKMLLTQGCGGMKGGLGTSSIRVGDAVVGAMAVLNSVGDIVDWRTGKIVAGARRKDGKGFANIMETLKRAGEHVQEGALRVHDPALHSTTLIVVATTKRLERSGLVDIPSLYGSVIDIATKDNAQPITGYHRELASFVV